MSAQPTPIRDVASIAEPIIGRVALELSDDSIRAIAHLVAAELAARQGLSDDALGALKQNEAAALLSVDPATLIAWERQGKLVPFLRDGKVVRYSRQQIAAFIGGAE